MAIPHIGGTGIGLNLPAVFPTLYSNEISLAAGSVWIVPPGQWILHPGKATFVQFKDPVSGLWRIISTWNTKATFVSSDGTNYRVANLSGCVVGALLTNKGSAYTSAPTVTASSGGSLWQTILSPSLSSVTITTAGSGYTYPPIVIVAPPPTGGIQATIICALSAGAVNSVTVVNEGAGYSGGIPPIYVITDPRDASTTIVPAVLTGVLTAAGTVKACMVTDHGTTLTAVPTLTFAGGGGASVAATAIMAFCVTALTATIAGVAYGNAQPYAVVAASGIVAGTAANTNPAIEKSIFMPRAARWSGTSSAGGATQTTTGNVSEDPGLSQIVPAMFTVPAGDTIPTTLAQTTATVGGITDTFMAQPV